MITTETTTKPRVFLHWANGRRTEIDSMPSIPALLPTVHGLMLLYRPRTIDVDEEVQTSQVSPWVVVPGVVATGP